MPDRQTREAEVLIGNTAGARRRNPVVRLFTDFNFALRAARFALGLSTRMETEDRRVLEEVIFPYYLSQAGIHSVLFIGCDWYTKHYSKVFFRHHDYWTIDIEDKARKYGSRQHISDSLEFLDRYAPADRFDLIVCNGVFGFGLNSRDQCERALEQCHSRLKPGGHFLFGWTDVPSRIPVPLEELEGLKRFEPFVLPPLGTYRYVTRTPYRQTYDFYRKTTTSPN